MKWIFLAVTGLLLNGTGLSFFGDAVAKKTLHPDSLGAWFWEGTFALVLINAGICCVIEAGLTRLKRRESDSL
jgi:ABC-type Mn2+/Zn2+ transport system permease subunit